MANVKISGLPTASTPLTGAELVPVVQSGVTSQTTVDAFNYFEQDGTGAVATTVQTKLRETVSVKDFGAVGDGVTNDTAAIQAAIDTGNSVFFPKGTYVVSSLTIQNKSNVAYFGDGSAVLTNVGTSPTNEMFHMVGTLNNVVWRDLNITGNTNIAATNCAIGCSSGQTGTNLRFENLYIKDVSIGISLNANLSGSFNKSIITNCIFYNIVGEAGGFGYGVHLPYAYDTIVDSCLFDTVGRHDIYVPRGGRVTISNCHFLNHRINNPIASPRPAVMIARNCVDVKVIGCTFDTFWDGAIYVGHETGGTGDTQNTLITGCIFRNPKNAVAAIWIGEQSIPVLGGTKTQGVNITSCNFYIDRSVTSAQFVDVENGLNVSVRNCFIYVINNTSNYNAIVFGSSSYSPSVGQCAYVTAENCTYYVKGSAGEFRGVALDGYLGANVDTTVTVNNTQFYADSGITTVPVLSPAYGYANTGVQGRGRAGNIQYGYGTAAPTTGIWSRGATVNTVTPSSAGYIGWVCVSASISTTGSITSGTTALTVASGTGISNGDSITIVGAGAAGANLTTTVSAGGGTTALTLAASASTTVSGATVTTAGTWKTYGLIS